MVVILPAAARRAVPWKNGGGVTREVAVQPPGSDFASFDWRVSMAQVDAAGPFSAFAGIDRLLVVLAGQLRLSLPGRDPLILSASSAPLRFPGDALAYGEPLGGAVTDLNVMTRRGRCHAELQRHCAAGATELSVGAETLLVIALTLLTLTAEGGSTLLAPLDAARLENVAGCALASANPPGAAAVAFCVARIRWGTAAAPDAGASV